MKHDFYPFTQPGSPRKDSKGEFCNNVGGIMDYYPTDNFKVLKTKVSFYKFTLIRGVTQKNCLGLLIKTDFSSYFITSTSIYDIIQS